MHVKGEPFQEQLLCERLGFECPAVPPRMKIYFVPLAIPTTGKIRLTGPAWLTTVCVAKTSVCFV